MVARNLLFFNKHGRIIDLSFNLDDSVWRGTVHLDPRSAGLFKNESIFVIEEMEDSSGDPVYGLPRADSTNQSITADLDADIFGLYTTFVNSSQEIELVEVSDISKDLPFDALDSINPTTGRTVTDSNVVDVFRVNLYHNGSEREVEDQVIIKIGGVVVAEIDLYTESILEDERFGILGSLLPRQIPDSAEFIFRESDINEDKQDYELLNRKRKEFYVQFRELIPYEGTVLGIRNYLKFFGFYDLRMKEYWRNVENGNLRLRDVILYENEKLDDPTNIPQAPFYRLPDIGLFYDLLVLTGDFDEDGLPITEPSTEYTVQEILIKLLGLGEYLSNNEILGETRLRDIIGEAPFFKRIRLSKWVNTDTALEISTGKHPEFSISGDFGFIQDLRVVNNLFVCDVDNRDVSAESTPDFTFADKRGCWVGYFSDSYQDEPDIYDTPNKPIGHNIKLINETFYLPWKDSNFSWAELSEITPVVTWSNISSLNYYEIAWIVEWINDDPVDTRKYRKVVVAKADDDAFTELNLTLPYVGLYDVTLEIRGWNGQINKLKKNGAIEVRLQEVDFVSFFQFHESELQKWTSNHLRWIDLKGAWGDIKQDNRRFSVDQLINYRSTEINHYSVISDLGLPLVGTNNIRWRDLRGVSFAEMKYKNWSLLSFQNKRIGNIFISKYRPGALLQVGSDRVNLPDDLNISNWIGLEEFLNSLSGEFFSRMTWKARPLDNPKYIEGVTNGTDSYYKFIISGVGITFEPKVPRFQKKKLGTWRQLRGTNWLELTFPWGSKGNRWFTDPFDNSIRSQSIKTYDNQFVVPQVLPVYFVLDNCQINGKVSARWTITTAEGQEILDIISPNLVYTFKQRGTYNIKVEVFDNEGNSKVREFGKWFQVLGSDDFYELYYTRNLKDESKPVPLLEV